MTEPTAPPAVRVSELHMAYGSRTAVDGLSVELPGDRLTVVLGPNGAGKTTTIEVCEGLRRPQRGSVEVLGLPAGDRRLRPRVGVMLQSGGCYSGARATELVAHFARLYASPHDPRELSAALGLDRIGRTTYRRMSGGERARLSLALALVGRPELVFLDEPSAGLDPEGRELLWDFLGQVRAGGTTVVLTTHQLDEAEHLADHVVVLASGRLRLAGPLAELVGGEARLTFRAEPGLDLSGLAARLGPRVTTSEPAPGNYRADGAGGPAELAAVAAWAAEEGVTLRELGAGSRSLAEVYREATRSTDAT